jgi:hypothetical protein
VHCETYRQLIVKFIFPKPDHVRFQAGMSLSPLLLLRKNQHKPKFLLVKCFYEAVDVENFPKIIIGVMNIFRSSSVICDHFKWRNSMLRKLFCEGEKNICCYSRKFVAVKVNSVCISLELFLMHQRRIIESLEENEIIVLVMVILLCVKVIRKFQTFLFVFIKNRSNLKVFFS